MLNSSNYTLVTHLSVRERPFDFYGGGRKTSQKKISGCDLREKKLSGPKGRQKKFSGLPWEALSHSNTCFRTPKSAFRTPKSAFAVQNLHFALRKLLYALQKNYIIYRFGNDFSHYKKEVFCCLKKVSCKPPPPNGLMKWAPWGFKKNSPARRAGEKNSPAPKIGKKNSPAHLSLPAPPHKNQMVVP